jgi:hypothetical protein
VNPEWPTLREVYDATTATGAKVDRLVDKVEEVSRHTNEHGARLRDLESRRWPVQLVTIVIALAALVLSAAKGGWSP